ncbi:MAG: hypothetical protein QXM52_06090 [Candidatus Bathyarchaeia archaeon]
MLVYRLLAMFSGRYAAYKRRGAFRLRRSFMAGIESKVFCDIYLCANTKKFNIGSEYGAYPCEKYDKGIFSRGVIKWIREKLLEN